MFLWDHAPVCIHATMPDPAMSLVIPAYNEAGYLPRLLDTVDTARLRYAGGPDAVEVIVADNGSTDGTPALAESRGCRLAHEAVRNIGAVRNAGAAVARGRVLCFADADLRIHPDTFNVIDRALGPRVIPGIRALRRGDARAIADRFWYDDDAR
jgi:glycosyltransferase involved in cell wall biosynthesis